MGRWREAGFGWECRPDGHWLTTERLVLRPLTPLDTDALLEVWSDPEFASSNGFPSDRTLLSEWARLACDPTYERPDGHQAYNWAICDRTSGEVIGVRNLLAYKDSPWQGRGCYTGGGLKAGWRGRGYGTEELWAVVQLVARHLGYGTVLAQTDPDNKRARRLHEKCGFKEDGIEAGHELPDGKVLDAIWLRRTERADATCRYAVRPPSALDKLKPWRS